jgi:hypothetical protein
VTSGNRIMIAACSNLKESTNQPINQSAGTKQQQLVSRSGNKFTS